MKNENNIVEVFKSVSDSLNGHNDTNCKIQNKHMIGSITFGRSCIIIKKKQAIFF
jgi:hypothetical protein